ncbi:MAG: response regulator [Sulfurimonas sp.]
MNKILLYIIVLTLLSLQLSAAIQIGNIDTQNESFTLWMALFSLAIVGIIAVYLFSEKLNNFKKKIKEIEEATGKINQTQDQIASSMGENIQNIAKENVAIAKRISNDKLDIENGLRDVIHSEDKLLAVTTNLIEFLRIKSKKIKIVNETMNLTNLLNDIVGTLKINTKNLRVELIYDVQGTVPENFKGDTLNIGKILVNLLLYCVENSATEVILKISKSNIFNKKENLTFTISCNTNIGMENSENIFNANYNEETNSYDSLGLFIAKELSNLLGGKLIAVKNKENLKFVLDIPLAEEESKEEISIVKNKKVYIVDTSYNASLAIKNIFSGLGHNPTVDLKDNFLLNPPNFSEYDLFVIDEKLYTKKVINALDDKECKSISANNIFKDSQEYINSTVADKQLNKPFTRQQLNETMEEFFVKNTESSKVEITNSKDTLEVYRNTFDDTKDITLNKFAEFRGTHVLLVEDNYINQKVFSGVLGKSGMKITIANHGQEALKMLESDRKIDIVFMDINMPIMDGYVASSKIREDEKFNNIPIIALSALTAISDVENMFNCGMNGYLAKPLKKEKLFTVFAQFIKERKEDRRRKTRKEISIEYLDGLNVKLGISQSSSSEIFYKEILSEFQDAYGDSARVFDKLVKDFRYEQLRMLCVDIRGLSGSIGAEDMQALATEILQRLLFKKYELVPSFVKQYSNELDRINRSITQYLK